MIVQRRLKLIALRRQIGECTGQLGERFFRHGKGRLGLRHASLTPQSCVALVCASALSAVSSASRRSSAGWQRRPRASARVQIGRKLFEPAIEFANPLLGARLLALQRLAGDEETLQCRGRPGFRLAQRRKSGGDIGLPGRSNSLLAGARGDNAYRLVFAALGVNDFGLRADPA